MGKQTNSGTSPGARLRTPDEVADAAIERFAKATSAGASVDADAWKRAISAEARAFAQELIHGAAGVVIDSARGKRGGKTEAAKLAGDIKDKLAECAG